MIVPQEAKCIEMCTYCTRVYVIMSLGYSFSYFRYLKRQNDPDFFSCGCGNNSGAKLVHTYHYNCTLFRSGSVTTGEKVKPLFFRSGEKTSSPLLRSSSPPNDGE
jgi:hypothetical protein